LTFFPQRSTEFCRRKKSVSDFAREYGAADFGGGKVDFFLCFVFGEIVARRKKRGMPARSAEEFAVSPERESPAAEKRTFRQRSDQGIIGKRWRVAARRRRFPRRKEGL